jgi:hypothetical protein
MRVIESKVYQVLKSKVIKSKAKRKPRMGGGTKRWLKAIVSKTNAPTPTLQEAPNMVFTRT